MSAQICCRCYWLLKATIAQQQKNPTIVGSKANLEREVKHALQGNPQIKRKVPSPVPSLLPGSAASTLS